MPGPGVSTSLGQVSTTSSTKTSTSDLQPTATSGDAGAGAGQDLPLDQDFSDIDSLPGWSDRDSEDGEISDSETQEQNEEMNYGRHLGQSGPY